MAIMATAGGGDGKAFAPAPAGVHQAVCVDVMDLGILDVIWQGVTKKQHKVNVAWQISQSLDNAKPFLVFKRTRSACTKSRGYGKIWNRGAGSNLRETRNWASTSNG